jgi:hypothetical protein
LSKPVREGPSKETGEGKEKADIRKGVRKRNEKRDLEKI